MTQSKIQKLREIIKKAVDDGINLALERYTKLKSRGFDNFYLPKHADFPSMSEFSSGLPAFSITPAYYGFEVSYAKILSDSKEDVVLESWQTLIDYFLNDADIATFFDFQDRDLPDEMKARFLKFSILETLRSLIDAIIHTSKNHNISSRIKHQKIDNWISSITKEAVEYELLVPILIHQPDCTKFQINENIRIQKIDKNLQLSRNFKLPRNTIAHEHVVGAATHAIIINNQLTNIPNNNRSERHKILEEKVGGNYDLVLKLFSIIRLVINDSVGFCQLICKPVGFEENWFANLPDVDVFALKKYPPHYDEGIWHEKKVITKKQLSQIKKYFNLDINNNKLTLAKRKLFESDLRTNKDDSVLDIATGLEALLSDSSDNLKYKISLRSAIICKKKNLYEFTPIEVKKGIKTFYDLRSAIVHGNTNKNKKKEVKLDRFNPIDTLWFGRNVLNHIINFMALNPRFTTAENIDDYLLKGK